VFGVSADSIESHQKFAAKYDLNFPLIADPDHKIIEPFGAWVEKHMYGKTYMGIQRCTFVVGPNGKIEQVWEKVTDAGAHANEVLAYLKDAAPADRPKEKAAKPKQKMK
jgi:peroxiredoxin Q/BCP